MAGATLNNKRKRNQTDAAADSSKKSKKPKNPPPAEPKEDEEASDEEEESRYEDAVSNLEQENDKDGESDAGEGSDLEDNAVAKNADGDVIPADSAPILSTLAESDKFEDLKLSEKTMRAIQEMGFTKMTSIQRSVRLSLQIFALMTCCVD